LVTFGRPRMGRRFYSRPRGLLVGYGTDSGMTKRPQNLPLKRRQGQEILFTEREALLMLPKLVDGALMSRYRVVASKGSLVAIAGVAGSKNMRYYFLVDLGTGKILNQGGHIGWVMFSDVHENRPRHRATEDGWTVRPDWGK